MKKSKHEPEQTRLPVKQLGGGVVAGAAVVLGVMVWSLWPGLAKMVGRWENDARYSHGYLVPLFALALLYVRRPLLAGKDLSPSLWGLALVGAGGLVQLAGGYLRVDWLDGIALLPYVAGLVTLVGGWSAFRWAWPSVAYLGFMVPLPWRFENLLGGPLQLVATKASTFALQTIGLMAFSEGNVIQLNEAKIGVVEACNGLSMLITFLALSTAAAMVVKLPWMDRAVLVLSAIPVAILSNVIRIVVTGVLYEKASSEWAEHFYHDLAGWLMIPLALVLYWLVVKVWSLMFVLEDESAVQPVALTTITGLAASRGASETRVASSPGGSGRAKAKRG